MLFVPTIMWDTEKHAKVNCLDQNCKKKECQQRDRKYCRCGSECQFKSKRTCESRHETEQHEKEMQSNNEKERQCISETNSLKKISNK